MEEFTISFKFRGETHTALVLQKNGEKEIEFDIRPSHPFIVREFGHQIRIFKEKQYYAISRMNKDECRDFFDSLVIGIRAYAEKK